MAGINLALALERQQRVLEALDAVGRAVALAPHETDVLRAEGAARSERRRARRARVHARGGAGAQPDVRAAALRIREPARERRRTGAAAQAYAQAVRLDPGHGPALSQLVFLKRWLADWRDLHDARAAIPRRRGEDRAPALPVRAARPAVDARRAASLRGRLERGPRRPPASRAPSAVERHAANRLPVRRLPHACDGVPRRGPVRAARSRAVRRHSRIRWAPTTASRCASA